MKKLLCIILVFIVNTLSFSQLLSDQNALFQKKKGEEILYLYQEINESNMLLNKLEYEHSDSHKELEWTIAQGYLKLNKRWEYEYDVQRHFLDDREVKFGYRGWDTLQGFVTPTNDFKLWGQDWTGDAGIMIEYNTYEPDQGEDNRHTYLAARTRIRTFNDKIGLEGTYWGFDLWQGIVSTTGEDGYGLRVNALSGTNWGYGWQTFNTIHNEYYDYQDYNGIYLLNLNSITRWTYHFENNWAFSTEFGMDNNNYFGGTSPEDYLNIYIYPHLLFNYLTIEGLRFYGEIGIKPFNYENFAWKDSDNGCSFRVILGVIYRW